MTFQPEHNPPAEEKQPTLDFLDEQLRVKIEISDEAFIHFPEITEEMLQTRREVFRLFLGTWLVAENNLATVRIEAVFEIPDQKEIYEESEDMIHINNFPKIQQLAAALKTHFPDYSHLSLIGDLHTHPVRPEACPPETAPYQPSNTDLISSISLYREGDLDAQTPYLFSVAGRLESGQTAYTTYRVIRTQDGYGIQQLE